MYHYIKAAVHQSRNLIKTFTSRRFNTAPGRECYFFVIFPTMHYEAPRLSYLKTTHIWKTLLPLLGSPLIWGSPLVWKHCLRFVDLCCRVPKRKTSLTFVGKKREKEILLVEQWRSSERSTSESMSEWEDGLVSYLITAFKHFKIPRTSSQKMKFSNTCMITVDPEGNILIKAAKIETAQNILRVGE